MKDTENSIKKTDETNNRYSSDTIRVLVFKIADHEHAVNIDFVKEILRSPNISPVIEAPDFMEGVINLRDKTVPIMNLRKRLYLPNTPEFVHICIVILQLKNRLIGFIVDSVSEILTIPTNGIEPPDEIIGGTRTRFIEGVIYLEDRFLVLLNLNQILTIDGVDLGFSHLENSSTSASPPLFFKERGGEFDRNPTYELQKIIAFELDDELYGVYINDVTEIMKKCPIMPLPEVPDFILGLINLRGIIIPVIDLRRLFHLNQKSFTSDTHIIIMKSNELQAGIIVDRLWELLRLPSQAFQPPPPDAARINAAYFKEVAQIDDRILIVLDIMKILTESKQELIRK